MILLIGTPHMYAMVVIYCTFNISFTPVLKTGPLKTDSSPPTLFNVP